MATRHALDYAEDDDNLLHDDTLSPSVRLAAEALARALADEYALDEDGECFTILVCPDEHGGEAQIVGLFPPDADDGEESEDDGED